MLSTVLFVEKSAHGASVTSMVEIGICESKETVEVEVVPPGWCSVAKLAGNAGLLDMARTVWKHLSLSKNSSGDICAAKTGLAALMKQAIHANLPNRKLKTYVYLRNTFDH